MPSVTGSILLDDDVLVAVQVYELSDSGDFICGRTRLIYYISNATSIIGNCRSVCITQHYFKVNLQ